MSDIQARVNRCFRDVFPDLSEADLPRASQASLESWDSVAQVTLLSAVAEEFQIELDEEMFESLSSYSEVMAFAQRRFA